MTAAMAKEAETAEVISAEAMSAEAAPMAAEAAPMAAEAADMTAQVAVISEVISEEEAANMTAQVARRYPSRRPSRPESILGRSSTFTYFASARTAHSSSSKPRPQAVPPSAAPPSLRA